MAKASGGSALPGDLMRQGLGSTPERRTYTEAQLEEAFEMRLEPGEKMAHRRDLRERRRAGKAEPAKGGRAVAAAVLDRVLPCIHVLRTYQRQWAVYDLLSGISVGLFVIPQAIASSLLANLNPQQGFYTAFFAMSIYFLFGTSKHLNISSQGAVSLLVGDAVRSGMEQVYPNGAGLCTEPNQTTPDLGNVTSAWTQLATTATTDSGWTDGYTGATQGPCVDPNKAKALVALTLTMIAGAVQLLMGAAQLGFVTIYLSDQLNSAFTCGAALHILTSQLGYALGTTLPPIKGVGKFFLFFVEAVKKIVASDVNWYTVLVFAIFFVILLAVKLINEKCSKYVKLPIPIDLLALIASLLLSKFLRWNENLSIDIVGDIGRGFEAPQAPLQEHFTTGSGIIVNGLVLGIMSYSLSVTFAKTFAMRHGYEVDSNQELIAYGAVNFIMSWFSTFVTGASIACTGLHESMKGKTLVYSLYAVLITLIGILTFAPEFEPVPKCVLSAIILVNLKNMMLQFDQLPRLWRTNRYDFAIWIVTLVAVLLFDLAIGLLIGVVFSLATVIYRSQAPKAYLLGRVPETDIYRNVKKNKGTGEIEGVKIFKFDGSLYFASAENFRGRLFRQVAMNPKEILARARAHAKLEGEVDGEIDLRTDVLQADAVRRALYAVTKEGEHQSALARHSAQLGPEDPEAASAQSGPDGLDVDSADGPDDRVPTVNTFCVILDMSACAFTDSVGIRLLTQIVEDFSSIGVEIYLSGCASLVRSQLRKGGFFAKRSEAGLFVTVHDAVLHALCTFYSELLEDERASLSSDRVGSSQVCLDSADNMEERRPSSGSQERAEPEEQGEEARAGRERRRVTRKVSRQRDGDLMLQRYRKASERLRQLEDPPLAEKRQRTPTGGGDRPGVDSLGGSPPEENGVDNCAFHTEL